MALRLEAQVVRGEIDCRIRGRVRGQVWLVGQAAPLRLELEGNPWRDLAGCRLEFENPQPQASPRQSEIATDQTGLVGDITASRKARVPDVPLHEFLQRRKRGEIPPEHWANVLYLEWFSRSNGRVVIESADFILKPSLPEWRMTEAEEQAQREKNTQALHDFLGRLTEMVERDRASAAEDPEAADGKLDEFAWEKRLRASDALNDKYLELLDKYGADPDGEAIIHREMGWDQATAKLTPEQKEWLADLAAADAAADAADAADAEAAKARGGSGDDLAELAEHPLVRRASDSAMELWIWCDDQGLLGDGADADVFELTFKAQVLSAKLAGALNGLADVPREDGLVVAALKRALPHLDAALAAARHIEEKTPPPMPRERLDAFRRELFAIREEILQLMDACRRKR